MTEQEKRYMEIAMNASEISIAACQVALFQIYRRREKRHILMEFHFLFRRHHLKERLCSYVIVVYTDGYREIGRKKKTGCRIWKKK